MRRLLVATLAVPLLAGCGADQDDYCEAVEHHQQELTELTASTEPGAALETVRIFRDLQDKAPSDIADEWQVLVTNLGAPYEAVEAAGVDPETYDPQNPPPGVTPAERRAIRDAVRGLTARETLDAHLAVDQQVRDVCHTPLTL